MVRRGGIEETTWRRVRKTPDCIKRIKIINVIVNDRVREPIREMISRDAECESRARAHVRSERPPLNRKPQRKPVRATHAPTPPVLRCYVLLFPLVLADATTFSLSKTNTV